jgi:hypothetical protein
LDGSVLCEGCGWTADGIPTLDAANAAAESHEAQRHPRRTR